MELTCYQMDSFPVDIRPAEPRRPWMDLTPKSFAYKCLPLSTANAHGWEIRSPVTFTATWNGGARGEDIDIEFHGGDTRRSQWVASHFGSGILTFVPSVVLRTSPGYNLWVTGPANEFKDGTQPLSALIETDWMPYSFTMNWKLTRPELPVRFEAGEPYCFFFPVPRGVIERCEPTLRSIQSDPVLVESFECAYGRRLAVHDKEGLKKEEPRARKEIIRESHWYMRGLTPDGSTRITAHQTKIRPKPFRREDDAPSPDAGTGSRNKG